MTYANNSSNQGASKSIPIVGAVLGVAGIAAGTLLGLKGIQVSTDEEIAPVLDTAETAGASYEDLARLEALLKHNVQNGIEVVFGTEYGSGTLGQYNLEFNQILITPETIDMGLEDTMKTLLHETTHALQDSIDGLQNSTMSPVGVDANAEGVAYLEQHYSGLSQHDHALEVEANSSEFSIDQSFDHFGIDAC